MRKNWPIVVLAVALITIVCVSSYANPSGNAKQPGTGTNTPAKGIAHDETAQPSEPTQSTEESPFWRRLFAWPEGVAALAILLTLFFIAWQAMLMRQTVMSADDASKRELRAYLTTWIGEATYQQRRTEEAGGDLMFAVRPLLLNTGRTPARKIKFTARAAILPIPLPKETHLPEGADEGLQDSLLGSQQNAFMGARVDGFRPDNEVDGIKGGYGSIGLYAWGMVTYEDVFGESHFVRYCHHITWDRANEVRGFFTPGRNDAD
jgi:hypothetical protein